jgi:hypothetical protein
MVQSFRHIDSILLQIQDTCHYAQAATLFNIQVSNKYARALNESASLINNNK